MFDGSRPLVLSNQFRKRSLFQIDHVFHLSQHLALFTDACIEGDVIEFRTDLKRCKPDEKEAYLTPRSQHPSQFFHRILLDIGAQCVFPITASTALRKERGIPECDHGESEKEHRLSRKSCETEVEYFGLLRAFCTKQSTVC